MFRFTQRPSGGLPKTIVPVVRRFAGRARLGVLLVWRQRRLRPEERRAEGDRVAVEQRLLLDRQLAAEALHRLVIGAHRVASEPASASSAEPETISRGAGWRVAARPLLYLNARQAESGHVGRVRLRRDYVLACRFFHCGIMDRTRSLDQGFDYVTLDPIPNPARDGPSFAELCDQTGAALISEALDRKKPLHVLWSGGIDSTSALIAAMKASEEHGCREIVRVLVSYSSVQENPRFFQGYVAGRYRIEPVSHPVSEFLDGEALNVTGEHGDQLFGSQLLESYVRRGLAGAPYGEILPFVLMERLRNPVSVYRVRRYLEPVIAAAPVPIRTLFDYMWWLNFALKWQDVTLRLTALRANLARDVYDSLHHFFRAPAFQAWSLAHPSIREVPTWARYKEPAKRYILAFTGDEDYYRTKEKEDSLRNVLIDPHGVTAFRAYMRNDFHPVVTKFTPTLLWTDRVRGNIADRLG